MPRNRARAYGCSRAQPTTAMSRSSGSVAPFAMSTPRSMPTCVKPPSRSTSPRGSSVSRAGVGPRSVTSGGRGRPVVSVLARASRAGWARPGRRVQTRVEERTSRSRSASSPPAGEKGSMRAVGARAAASAPRASGSAPGARPTPTTSVLGSPDHVVTSAVTGRSVGGPGDERGDGRTLLWVVRRRSGDEGFPCSGVIGRTARARPESARALLEPTVDVAGVAGAYHLDTAPRGAGSPQEIDDGGPLALHIGDGGAGADVRDDDPGPTAGRVAYPGAEERGDPAAARGVLQQGPVDRLRLGGAGIEGPLEVRRDELEWRARPVVGGAGLAGLARLARPAHSVRRLSRLGH